MYFLITMNMLKQGLPFYDFRSITSFSPIPTAITCPSQTGNQIVALRTVDVVHRRKNARIHHLIHFLCDLLIQGQITPHHRSQRTVYGIHRGTSRDLSWILIYLLRPFQNEPAKFTDTWCQTWGHHHHSILCHQEHITYPVNITYP